MDVVMSLAAETPGLMPRQAGAGFDCLQEFACDEVLVGRRGVSSKLYGTCLLRKRKRWWIRIPP
jgi:hypothetical protein